MSEFTINVVQDPSTVIDISSLDQAVSLNISQNQPNSIIIEDDAKNVLLNPSIFYNGINIVYLSGVSGELLHNTFGDLQGGTTGQYYHLTSGQYFNLTTGAVVRPSDTGNFITTSQTGAFYPTSNPSGFITGVNLSGYVTGDVVRPSETGSFITTSQTGAFYPRSNPSGFITGVDLSSYSTITFSTGISGSLQNQITNLNNQTGSYYLKSNPSGFITGMDLSAYVTGSVVRPSETGAFYPISNPSGYITGVDLSNYSTIPFSTGISGYLQNQVTNLNNQTGSYYPRNNPSGYITGVNLSGYVTGDVIRPSDTGAFYPVTNPSGYITGVDLSSYATIGFVTGISGYLQPQITNLNNQTGSYVTGSVVRPSETGAFYPNSNPSGYISSNQTVALTNKTIDGANNTITNVSISTGVSGLASGVATFLAAPTSTNLAAAVTDETGTGALVFGTGPTISSPIINTAITLNATTYTYGSGAATAHRDSLGVGPRISALAANTSVTSTTTLQTVASLSVVAGKTYAVAARIAIAGTANTGTRHGINFPSGTYIRLTRKRATSYIPVEVSSDLNLGIAEATTLAELEGFITVSTSGTVNLLFAQNTSHADTTTCRTFTFLKLTEVF
jgi:hypothetical protein